MRLLHLPFVPKVGQDKFNSTVLGLYCAIRDKTYATHVMRTATVLARRGSITQTAVIRLIACVQCRR